MAEISNDVRGYGTSYAPKAIDEYRLVHLAGDCVGVVQALGEDSSVIVGHDWGGKKKCISAGASDSGVSWNSIFTPSRVNS